LKLALIPPFPTSIIVSHQKAVGLKEWLDRWYFLLLQRLIQKEVEEQTT
jgi:hypothetical protein